MLVMTDIDKPATPVIELHLEQNEKVRQVWPYLRDRRIDAYEGLTLRLND